MQTLLVRSLTLATVCVLTAACTSNGSGGSPNGPVASTPVASTKEGEPSLSSRLTPTNGTPVLQRVALHIGANCELTDGYQFDEGLHLEAGVSGPTAMVPSGVDLPDLPPGVGYCIRGRMFPLGYFTSNCKTDGDCPAGDKCFDQLQCRAPCSADSDCTAPTSCHAVGRGTVAICSQVGGNGGPAINGVSQVVNRGSQSAVRHFR